MEINELWQQALGEISVNVSKPIFLSWFKNADLLEVQQDGVAIISCRNNFTKEWLQEKCHKLILRSLRNVDSNVKNVSYVVRNNTKNVKQQNSKPFISDTQLQLPDLDVDPDTNLNQRYSLQNFIVGSHNEVAHAAAMAIIEHPGTRFNPLFIYGGTGLGKTHLLQAIGNEIKRRYPNKKIRYVTSEKFTGEFVNSILHHTPDKFKERYRPLDVLLIDDVQFFADKNETQQELFHTFNALSEKNKQIVFSSDRPPKAIPGIEERLASRFVGGMQADIGYPDFETRVAILNHKLTQLNYQLDSKIVEFIASKVTKNIRELEGALNHVIGYSRLKGANPTHAELERILGEIFSSPAKTVTSKQIIKAVAEFYDISEKDIVAKSRKKEVVKPRQIAMYLLRTELKNSFPSIGEKFGGRDHTTVMHACLKIEKEIHDNPQLTQEINTIKEKMFTV